ncbi:DUF3175 domain-containing protein [Pedobacter sp. BS3]|uniref:DUF3175 domain-containing protein n=1 Tax=Pedobacter sp. BS3 TaxID=2567937 RepID=UPI0011F02EC0|nr:DUF3175 domain-containing protein [Pedobacter sp. BS3]TZF82088.1 DUF3175 domain-containing protein [Pedobacter sp. BS3]
MKKSSHRGRRTGSKKKWSAKVTSTSNAMDLEKDIFKSGNPEKIARSVKHSAETSKRRKAGPFQSAMSMLNFYLNRAGKNLSRKEKEPIEKAKNKPRKLYGREEK